MKVLEDEPNLLTKIIASLNKSVFSKSKNNKIGTAKKAAKQKADDDLMKTFKEDTEVNKKHLVIDEKRLALEMVKTNTVKLAVHNDFCRQPSKPPALAKGNSPNDSERLDRAHPRLKGTQATH
jgi:hypothetical protein